MRKAQRELSCGRRNGCEYLPGCRVRLLSWKFAFPHQNPDVIDAKCGKSGASLGLVTS